MLILPGVEKIPVRVTKRRISKKSIGHIFVVHFFNERNHMDLNYILLFSFMFVLFSNMTFFHQ